MFVVTMCQTFSSLMEIERNIFNDFPNWFGICFFCVTKIDKTPQISKNVCLLLVVTPENELSVLSSHSHSLKKNKFPSKRKVVINFLHLSFSTLYSPIIRSLPIKNYSSHTDKTEKKNWKTKNYSKYRTKQQKHNRK